MGFNTNNSILQLLNLTSVFINVQQGRINKGNHLTSKDEAGRRWLTGKPVKVLSMKILQRTCHCWPISPQPLQFCTFQARLKVNIKEKADSLQRQVRFLKVDWKTVT